MTTTNNTVYISLPSGFTPSSDFPDIAASPVSALQARGYTALPGANDVISMYITGNEIYMYAAILTFSTHSVTILFYDLIGAEYFLSTYAPIAPVLEQVLNL